MDPSNTIRHAIALAQGGDKPQARRLVIEVLQNDPSNADAWVVMAQIVDAPEEAIACMQKAVALRPDDEHARRYLEYLQEQNPPVTSPETLPDRSTVSPVLVGAGLGLMALLCIIGLLLSGLIPLGREASAGTSSGITCRELIDQVLKVSDANCQRLDRDQVCYGHTTMKASLQPGTAGRFEQTGDVLSIGSVTRLSAAPLDLNTRDWGVGIFKVQANLAYTMPGELVTMVVVGDTSVESPSRSMEVFTFSSGIGGIDCDTVPVNGLMVRMPDGTGIRFQVNGSDLALSGNAFLQAEVNGRMQVSMVDGGGWISSKGVSRFFKSGETVSVPLVGLTSDGPPTAGAGSQNDLCTLFGTCSANNPGRSSAQSIAMIQAAVTESADAIPASIQDAEPTSTPEPIDPRLPTNTPMPVDPRIPTNTPVPVAPGMPTNTSVPLPTNTSAPRPTNTPGPAATSKPGSSATSTQFISLPKTATSSAPNTSMPAATQMPSPTNTSAPEPTNTSKPPTSEPNATATKTPAPPTDTQVPPATEVPTSAPAANCDNITLGWGGVSKSTIMTINVANNNASDVTLTHIDITWPTTNGDLGKIKLGSTFWNGTEAPPSAAIDGSKSIGASSTESLAFTFASAADSGYAVTLTFDIGCTTAEFTH